MPALPLLAPSATSPAASSRHTLARVAESRAAIAHPSTPPPTTATSTRVMRAPRRVPSLPVVRRGACPGSSQRAVDRLDKTVVRSL